MFAKPRLSRQQQAETPDFNPKTHLIHPGMQPLQMDAQTDRYHNACTTPALPTRSALCSPANARICCCCCCARCCAGKADAPPLSPTDVGTAAAPRWVPPLHAALQAAAVGPKQLPLGADHSRNIYHTIYIYILNCRRAALLPPPFAKQATANPSL